MSISQSINSICWWYNARIGTKTTHYNMMYNKYDLLSVDVFELMRIANELGAEYKKTDSQETIIYAILEKQAEMSVSGASKSTSKSKARTTTASEEAVPKRKRGRPRKVSVATTADEATAQKPHTENDTIAESADVSTAGIAVSDEATPEDIQSKTDDAAVETPVKKRGRKKKSETEALAAASDDNADATMAEQTEETTTVRRRRIRTAKAADTEAVALPLFASHAEAEDADELQQATSSESDKQPSTDTDSTEVQPSDDAIEPHEQQESFVPQLQHDTIDNPGVSEQGVWLGDPGDGTDFIVMSELPYYDTMSATPAAQNTNNRSTESARPASVQPSFSFDNIIEAIGVLEVSNDSSGILRSSDYYYMPSPDDIHLTSQQVRRYALKTGDVVLCHARPPHEGEKNFVVTSIDMVNGRSPEHLRDRIQFENLTPLFPQEKFNLSGDKATTNLSTRIVDLFTPIGKGQRALIVAQPKTGKTLLMKDIANAIAANHPEAYLMMLLIDERPEEVTDMSRTVKAEVVASTFDEPAEHHVKIANIVLEKAKRLVECGHDVVIFLDSITRLARAYNTVTPASSRILTGGVDANALQKPKRFFGAARKIEGGGSLTIIATALIDTGSKMDEVIFEEFKGTGNMELQLDRSLSNKRIFPAVNLVASSTRRDELLQDKTTLDRMWILRKHIADMNAMEAMKTIYDRMMQSENNDEFLATMNS